jgi:hypothetical protein
VSHLSEEDLKKAWHPESSIVSRTLEGLGDLGLQMASGAGRLAIELPEALWDWGKGEAFNERQFFQYDADMRENATREYIRSKFPALDRMLSYEGDTPIAEMGKAGGERIANVLNPFWENLAQSGKDPGVRGDVAISTAGPIASVVGATRLLTSPVVRSAATRTSGSAQVTLARKIDNFRDKHGLADKNLLMDTAKRVGEDRFSMGPYTITQKNDLRKVESDIKALNRFQPKY